MKAKAKPKRRKRKSSRARPHKGPRTRRELAAVLGVNVRALAVHIRAGGPPLHDVAAWSEWMATKGRAPTAPPDIRREQAQLKKDMSVEQLKKARRENMVEDGLLVSAVVVGAGLRRVMDELFSTLDRVFCAELPPLIANMDEMKIKGRATKEIETLKNHLRARFQGMAAEVDKAEALPAAAQAVAA